MFTAITAFFGNIWGALLSLFGRAVNRPYATGPTPGTISRAKTLDRPFGACHVLSHRDRFGESTPDQQLAILTLARSLGIQYVRGGILEVDYGSTYMAQRAQYHLNKLKEVGMKGIVIFHPPSNPLDMHWPVWCESLALSLIPYGAEAFEFGNEPNPAFDPLAYANLLIAAAGGIRKAGKAFPNLPYPLILNGGIAGAAEYKGWFSRVLSVPGARDAFDILSVHPYEEGFRMLDWAQSLGKPVWITEDGRRGGSESQALYGSYAYLERYPLVQKVFWYCGNDHNPDYAGYWMWDENLGPLPTANAYKTLTGACK